MSPANRLRLFTSGRLFFQYALEERAPANRSSWDEVRSTTKKKHASKQAASASRHNRMLPDHPCLAQFANRFHTRRLWNCLPQRGQYRPGLGSHPAVTAPRGISGLRRRSEPSISVFPFSLWSAVLSAAQNRTQRSYIRKAPSSPYRNFISYIGGQALRAARTERFMEINFPMLISTDHQARRISSFRWSMRHGALRHNYSA